MASPIRQKAALAAALLIAAVGLLGHQLYPLLRRWAEALPEDKVGLQIERLRWLRPAVRRPPSLSSPREEEERGLFMDVLAARHADVLVLPFSATQAVSLDRTARSLMTVLFGRRAGEVRARSGAAPATFCHVSRSGRRARRAAVGTLARGTGCAGARRRRLPSAAGARLSSSRAPALRFGAARQGGRFGCLACGSRVARAPRRQSSGREGDFAAQEKLLKEALAGDPDGGHGYFQLAWFYVQRRDPQSAQKVMLSYPELRKQTQHPVELGNQIGMGADLLWRAGEPDLARPLLEFCAELQTGSGEQMQCEERLAAMQQNYASAAEHARESAERYSDAGAAAAYVRYLFLQGQSEAAWKAFDRWSLRLQRDNLQYAAAFGDRVLGRSDREIVNAVAQWTVLEQRPSIEGQLRDDRLFVALFPDRDASAETLALFEAAAGGSEAKFYVDLAKGYLAFERRDYKGAADAWRSVDRHLTLSFCLRGQVRKSKPGSNSSAGVCPVSGSQLVANPTVQRAAEARSDGVVGGRASLRVAELNPGNRCLPCTRPAGP